MKQDDLRSAEHQSMLQVLAQLRDNLLRIKKSPPIFG